MKDKPKTTRGDRLIYIALSIFAMVVLTSGTGEGDNGMIWAAIALPALAVAAVLGVMGGAK